jgi:undecaprenyl pyrophosphate phosphatase UppP
MRPRRTSAFWTGLALCVALGLSVAVLGLFGADQKGTGRALVVTARLSFLLFWPAYAGGAMTAVFGTNFQPIKDHAREFGLAFASAHLVHIGLVAWLCLIGDAPSVTTFIFFGIAVVWTYLLALFSIGRLQAALGRRIWWLFSTVGLNYIAFAFAVDFVNHAPRFDIKYVVGYLPFASLAVAGPLLRLAALTLRVGRAWRARPYRVG